MPERVQKERHIIFTLLYFEVGYDLYSNKFGTYFLYDFSDEIERLKRKQLIEILDNKIQLTPLGIQWHTNVLLEFFNDKFWADTQSVREPNWSLNDSSVGVGSYSREHWLGRKDQTFF